MNQVLDAVLDPYNELVWGFAWGMLSGLLVIVWNLIVGEYSLEIGVSFIWVMVPDTGPEYIIFGGVLVTSIASHHLMMKRCKRRGELIEDC